MELLVGFGELTIHGASWAPNCTRNAQGRLVFGGTVLDSATGGLVPASYKGNRLMNAPKWNGSAGFAWKIPAGPGQITTTALYTYTSAKFTNFTDLPQERVGSINLVNGTIGWSPDGERWSAGLFGRNIFNEKYYGQKLYLPGVAGLASLGAPREYGVDLKYRF